MDAPSLAIQLRRGSAFLVAVLISVLATATVEASPITSYAAVSSGTSSGNVFGPRWQAFLAGGPHLWAVEPPPRFPSHIKLATENGQIVETPFVAYLIWRRDLDPARFDHYHPIIGPILGSLPQTLVPEPPMLPLALTIAGAAIAYQRRRARVL